MAGYKRDVDERGVGRQRSREERGAVCRIPRNVLSTINFTDKPTQDIRAVKMSRKI